MIFNMNNNHYEIKIAGNGGQGILLLSEIIAEACGTYEKKEIVLTKEYGPESRGGSSTATLIIDNQEILYPFSQELDCILALTQKSFDEFSSQLKSDGIIIVDSTHLNIEKKQRSYLYCIPITQLTKDLTGDTKNTNIISLGVITALTGIVNPNTINLVLKKTFTNNFELYLEYFTAGYELAQRIKKI